MLAYGRFAAAMAKRVIDEVDVDLATFSEPIGGNDRPLISPVDYEQLILPGYRAALDVLQAGRARTIVFATYSNAAVLLDAVLDAGFNTLWAMEAETAAMDYRRLRHQYGRRLGLIGGIDLDALRAGRISIDRELQQKVPSLLAQGRYIPLADGRVRTGVSLDNYLYYRRRLAEMVAGG